MAEVARGIVLVARDTVLVTGFVLVMMLWIDFLQVATQGLWQKWLLDRRWKQYLLTAFLGTIPGCLGGFTDVALFIHGQVSFGALVGGMLAAAGDESFVMFAMIPVQALILHAVLFVLGLGAGFVVDAVLCPSGSWMGVRCSGMELHEAGKVSGPLGGRVSGSWRLFTAPRLALVAALALFLSGVMTGRLASDAPVWTRGLIVVAIAVTVVFVVMASDHLVEEHFWKHVVLKHLPQIFLWTFGSLAVLQVVVPALHLGDILNRGRWVTLVLSCLVGLIPESGPHMIFVVLYARGLVPFSVLLASSMVQDGHSALPLLAQSRRVFLVMKVVAFAFGLATGGVLMALGF